MLEKSGEETAVHGIYAKSLVHYLHPAGTQECVVAEMRLGEVTSSSAHPPDPPAVLRRFLKMGASLRPGSEHCLHVAPRDRDTQVLGKDGPRML